MTVIELPVHVPGMRFRHFVAGDIDALAAIRTATYPDSPSSADSIRHEETLWDAGKYWRARVLAEDDRGRAVAYGELSHMPWQFHPDRYWVVAYVLPEWRGRGLGRSILTWAEASAQSRGAISVRTEAKSDDSATVSFLDRRSYEDRQRNWESRLAIAGFDRSTFAPEAKRVAEDGITIATLGGLLVGAGTERRDAILAEYCALDTAATQDTPSLDPITPQPFETWRGYVIDGPEALPHATFLAVDRGSMVGMSALYRALAMPGVLTQGFTAVARTHRGRGIAQALKLRTVDYAGTHGYREIRTWNNSRNVPMLRINEAMGFAKEPAWTTFVKDVGQAQDRCGLQRLMQ